MKTNTLNKLQTQKFYNDPENGFSQIKSHWKSVLSNGYFPEAYDFLSYAILRGKDYRKGFTKIQRKSRLDNGAHPDLSFKFAMLQFIKKGPSEVFSEIIQPSAKDQLLELLPAQSNGSKWSSWWDIECPSDHAYVIDGVENNEI